MQILTIPTQCPICGGNTIIKTSDSGTQELFCNNPDCSGKLINKLEYFVSKKGLDIKGLSKAALEKLIDWGWVTCVSDLFFLDKYAEEWITKTGFGAKSVDKILTAIKTASNCELNAFISALSIPNIGRTYAKELADIFESYENFRGAIAAEYDFTTIDGFGPEKHESITNFDYAEADALVTSGIISFKQKIIAKEEKSLSCITVVVTGKLHRWKNRDEFKADIEARGGRVVDSVSTKTNYLVNNDVSSTSAKNKKAKELGIPILTEETFAELFEI